MQQFFLAYHPHEKPAFFWRPGRNPRVRHSAVALAATLYRDLVMQRPHVATEAWKGIGLFMGKESLFMAWRFKLAKYVGLLRYKDCKDLALTARGFKRSEWGLYAAYMGLSHPKLGIDQDQKEPGRHT